MERTYKDISKHALRRMNGRGIPEDALQAALRWGRSYWSHGDHVYRLDSGSVKRARAQGVRVDRYEGVTVVVTPAGVVRTAWRNRDPQRVWR